MARTTMAELKNTVDTQALQIEELTNALMATNAALIELTRQIQSGEVVVGDKSNRKDAPKPEAEAVAEDEVAEEKPHRKTREERLTEKYGDFDHRKAVAEMTKVVAEEWRNHYKATGELVVKRKKDYRTKLWEEAERRVKAEKEAKAKAEA